jgi:quercetin dioxygenase-like cupin family protein
MRQTLNVIVLASIATFLAGCESSNGMHAMSDHGPSGHVIVMADQVNWQSGPPSLPPGAKSAVLEGDPGKPGFFAIRAWLPAGYKVPPHFHPGVERVTVISGTFYLGEGDKIDESAAKAYPAGAYTSMPPGMHHFAYTKEATVIQIATMGPWGITYINPADDPRNAKK